MKTSSFKSFSPKLGFLVLCLVVGARSFAQKPSSPDSSDTPPGLTEIESFQGTVNSGESVLKLDSTLGWDFTSHFGMFAGVPLYLAHSSSSTTTTGTTTTTTPGSNHDGIGNAYLGFVVRAPNPNMDYSTALTLGAPTGNTKKGLSTGRATFDWDNQIEHAFGRFTPFLEGGVSNTVPDSRLLTRPFTSLGLVTHWQEGGGFDLLPHFSANGAAYEIVPFGNQKIFSRLVGSGQTAKGTGKKPPAFETAAETSGTGITQETGFSAWLGFDPTPIWSVELGYTRSVTFALNSFTFNLRMNVGKLLRSKNRS
jgi:hypothetical protein